MLPTFHPLVIMDTWRTCPNRYRCWHHFVRQAPEIKLREGGPDNDIDVSTKNWIHHNTITTYGNECVDVKEGSTDNLIEYNVCQEQKDSDSGCFGARGSDNTFRHNEIEGCFGGGFRLGGEKDYGTNNNVYSNIIKDAQYAFSIQIDDHGTVCDNVISKIGNFVSAGRNGMMGY